MSCEDCRELVVLHVGGDLEAASVRRLEPHLKACHGCQAFVSELRESQRGLSELANEPLPRAALDEVRAHVLRSLEPGAPMSAVRWLGAAAAVVLLLALSYRAWQPAESPTSPPTPPVAPESAPAESISPPPPGAEVAEARPPSDVVSRPEPQPSEPLTLRLLTDDPDIVIIWLVD